MKKFTKLLLSVILSVCLLVTGGIAFSNYNDAYATGSLYVDGIGVVTATGAGAKVEYGTYQQLRKAYTGVRLIGKTGATFNLGTVDLSKPYWGGTHNTVTGPFESLFNFVYEPGDSTKTVPDLKLVRFRFTELDSNGNKIENSYIDFYSHAGYEKGEIKFSAKASNQATKLCYRKGNSALVNSDGKVVRKTGIYEAAIKATGYGTGVTVGMNTLGQTSYAMPVIYDLQKNGFYSPITSNLANDLLVSYAVRDFDETTYDCETTPTGLETPFKFQAVQSADYKEGDPVYADVEVTFESASTESSIIITKLGENTFKPNGIGPNAVNVVEGITAVGGSVTYGNFEQELTGKVYRGVNLQGVPGSTFNLGTMNVNDTYFDDSWKYVKGTGVSTTKRNGAYYTGSNQAVDGVASDTRSFIDFVFNARGYIEVAGSVELFNVTLREIDNPETEVDESKNFITYHVRYYSDDKYTSGPYNGKKVPELLIRCSATNNSEASERFRAAGITLNEHTRRQGTYDGNQTTPFSLYYDVSENAAYTNIAFAGNADGISSAFRIRDFDAVTDTPSDYASIPSTIKNWEGFSENATLSITLTMGETFNTTTTQNSIILTSLAGRNFDDITVATASEAKTLANVDFDLNSLVRYKTSLFAYEHPNKVVASYEVDGEKFNGSVAKFTTDTTVKLYDANGNLIGSEVSIVISNLTSDITTVNATYEVLRDNAPVEGAFAIGDVIKFTPKKDAISNLTYSDVRNITVGNRGYAYSVETKNDNDIVTYNEEDGCYYYTISEGDLLNGVELKLYVMFDRFCDITIVNPEATTEADKELEYTAWASNGIFAFPYNTVGNYSTINRGTSTDKILIGYARIDAVKQDANGVLVANRTDVKVADYESMNTAIFYSGRELGNATCNSISDADLRPAWSIVPGMRFEMLYVKLTIETEIKLTSGHLNDYSGLRFVVKFDKEGIENALKYVSGSAYKNKNPFGFMFNYITTTNELADGGKNVALDKICSSNWLNDGWTSAKTANGLGLYNGTGKTDAEMANKPGYLVTEFGSRADIWHDRYTDCYAYAITVKNLNLENKDKEYVFMPLVRIEELSGSATSFVHNAIKVKPSDLAAKKLTEIISTNATDEDGKAYLYSFTSGEVTYYSHYTLTDIQWVQKLAGDTTEYVAING